MKTVEINNWEIGNNHPLFIIAGPCVIEDDIVPFQVAQSMQSTMITWQIPMVFKSSFNKANRTSADSFRGLPEGEAIQILMDIRELYGICVTTDIHDTAQAEAYSGLFDIIQIPALLSRQTDLLTAAATNYPVVNVKVGQFMSPWDAENIIKKIESCDQYNIILTYRGTCFGYNGLVRDMLFLPVLKEFGYPVVYDVGHSVQNPGGLGDRSGGMSKYIPVLARMGVAAHIAGIFCEIHPDPEKALCDGPNSLPLSEFADMAQVLKEVDDKSKEAERNILKYKKAKEDLRINGRV